MEAKTKDLWVFVETNEDGTAKNVGVELLTPGRLMADKQGGTLVAVVIGSGVDEAVKAASEHGADKILVVDGPEYKHYTTDAYADAYADALCALVEKYGPTSMLIGATNNGRDLGPRVSCRLKTGLTADCTGLDIDEESGNVAWTRPAFGGNLMATILCPDHRPQIGTVRPGVFKKSAPISGSAEIIKEDIHVSEDKIRTQVLEIIKEMGDENVDLEGAEIIVSGGRGVGGPEGFEPIKALAKELGATVGASRAAVDSGWIAHAHQVGQTGKTVGPKPCYSCSNNDKQRRICMNFHFNEEEREIIDMLRDFALKEVAPIAAEVDENEQFPEETWHKLAEMGMMGVSFPEKYGGAGLSYMTYIGVCEELAKHCATTSVMVSAHTSLCCWPIAEFGTEKQKQKYLPLLLPGEKLGAFGLTEPGAGTDAAMQKTIAEDKGDHWILNGSKIFITNAGYADIFVVFAMTNKELGTKGISAFIVERDFPGFTVGAHEKKMGIRGSSTCELVFEDCIVPKENLLGELNKGFRIAMMTLDGGRIGIGAQALGIAQAAVDACVKYTTERVQFGKRISQFQNTQFQLADMQTRVDAARLLIYRAAQAKQDHEPYSHLAAMGKLYASEAASSVTRRCLQLVGGYGYTREYPFERFMRDAKITEIYEGTSEVQRMVISSWMGVK